MPHNKLRRYLKHGTLPQLAVLEAAARLGSFTRAAEELYLAQPTVSVQIKKLSETMGLPLLEQVGKRVHLTDAGREVLAACQDIFQQLVALEDRLNALRGLKSGFLRIAATTAAKYFLPRVLGQFCRQYPSIDVSFKILNREQLLERLHRNWDDLYILASPPEEREVVIELLAENPMVALARSDHPLAWERKIPFQRFAREPFLMREPGSGTRKAVLELFAAYGTSPRVRMELDSDETIQQTLLAGLGVSIISLHCLNANAAPSGLALLDVQGLPIRHHWCAVYPASKALAPAAGAFLELLKKEAKTLIPTSVLTGRHASSARGIESTPSIRS